MAAIIELTDQQRAQLLKLLNNLNLGFVYSGFGEAFIAMLDGTPVTFEDKERAELVHLINNLNLSTWHLKAGDLLVGLMDSATQAATATDMTERQIAQLGGLLQHLNIGLDQVKIGALVNAAVPAIVAANAVPAPALEWDGAAPASGTIGTDVNFKWKGGTPNYKVTIKNPAGTDHDTRSPMSDVTYSLHTTSQAAGNWTIIIEDAAGVQLTKTITMAAAKVLKTIKLTGNQIKLTGSNNTAGYALAGLKIDASNESEITVAVDTDAGVPLPDDKDIKVDIFTAANSADLGKLDSLAVSGGKFTLKALVAGSPADADSVVLKVTAGIAAPVKLTVNFVA